MPNIVAVAGESLLSLKKFETITFVRIVCERPRNLVDRDDKVIAIFSTRPLQQLINSLHSLCLFVSAVFVATNDAGIVVLLTAAGIS